MHVATARNFSYWAISLSSRASFTTATRACRAAKTSSGPSGNDLLPQMFNQTVVLTDGSSATFRTTSPRPLLQLTKDPRNHPLWNPEMKTGLDDESGRLMRFTEKFGEMDDLEGLDTFDSDMEVESTSGKKKSK